MPQKKSPFLPSRREIFMLLGIVCLAGLLLLAVRWGAKPGDEVVITVEQREYGRFPLSENRVLEIEAADGMNVVEISDNQVHMKSADCPDRLCVKMGFIHDDIRPIVCLPHKVVVEVKPRG